MKTNVRNSKLKKRRVSGVPGPQAHAQGPQGSQPPPQPRPDRDRVRRVRQAQPFCSKRKATHRVAFLFTDGSQPSLLLQNLLLLRLGARLFHRRATAARCRL